MTSTSSHIRHVKLQIGAVIAALALIAGCSARPVQNDQKNDETPSASSSQSADSGPIEITDQRGQTVTLEKPAERIVTAVIPAPEMLAAIDKSWDYIVGVNESTIKFNKLGIAGNIFPKSLTTPVISTSDFVPNMETVLSLKPDATIQWGDQDDGAVIKPLDESGIPTFGITYGTQAELEEWVRVFSQIRGKPERGKEILDWMGAIKADIEKTVAGAEPITALVAQSGKDDQMRVFGKGSHGHDMLELLGAKNVAEEIPSSVSTITREDLLRWNPDYIFISTFSPDNPADFYNDPGLATLKAVQNKTIYRAPYGVFHWVIPCAENPMFWQWAAKLMHPEAYDVNIKETVTEGFEFLFGYTPTDEDLSIVMHYEANGGSKNYDLITE
ncbi:MAG: ABC transporter substrate-binding protein [Actinomycetaceae bacterium]|nr:ABC transporter substrate-binding protein [Actinomycetaceae bacterium]